LRRGHFRYSQPTAREGIGSHSFASRLLTAAESKYSIHEKKCLAVVWRKERFRVYLERKGFTLHIDNQTLSWLLRHDKKLGHIGRWIIRLAPYKFKTVHIPGKSNVVADSFTPLIEDPPPTFVFWVSSPTIAGCLSVHQEVPD
jgi:hypothetical protein